MPTKRQLQRELDVSRANIRDLEGHFFGAIEEVLEVSREEFLQKLYEKASTAEAASDRLQGEADEEESRANQRLSSALQEAKKVYDAAVQAARAEREERWTL